MVSAVGDVTDARAPTVRPDPAQAGDTTRFIHALAQRRILAGHTYKRLAARTGVPNSTLYDVLTGKRRPRTAVVEQIVRAYAADAGEAERWMQVWVGLRLAEPAAAPDTTPQGSPASIEYLTDQDFGTSNTSTRARRHWQIGVAVALTLAAATAGATVTRLFETADAKAKRPAEPIVELTVHNVEDACRPLRTLECALNLYRDPRAPRTDDNIAGRVWHSDKLGADCVVSDARLITDEKGMSSSRWYHVTVPGTGVAGWLPGVRTRNTREVPACRHSRLTPP
jgi:hypothetical protein